MKVDIFDRVNNMGSYSRANKMGQCHRQVIIVEVAKYKVGTLPGLKPVLGSKL